jgi:hypothetical protein
MIPVDGNGMWHPDADFVFRTWHRRTGSVITAAHSSFLLQENGEAAYEVRRSSATRQAAKEVGHMNKAEQVKYYRDRASSLREMAASIMDPAVRNNLQEIAEKFERLADYVENQRHGCTD